MRHRGLVFGLVAVFIASSGAWARVPLRSASDLDHLLAPVALYPDPLLAQILPAATDPEEVSRAVKYLEDQGDLDRIDAQPWNDNVKALARCPRILRMMSRNPDWTREVGAAFLDQPRQVLDAVQRLRQTALSAGALKTCDQQRVVRAKGFIYIHPSDPTGISVPDYDPKVVFGVGAAADAGVPVRFGSVMVVGYWLHHEVDWRKHRIYSFDYREQPYGRRNPWYGDGMVSGEVPADYPKMNNHAWSPARSKTRPRANVGAPVPEIRELSPPAQEQSGGGSAAPAAETRTLAPPKDLPPPPVDLIPVDPEMEDVTVAPAKPEAGKLAPGTKAKTVPAKGAKPPSAPAKTAPASATKTKGSPAKPAQKKPTSAGAAKAASGGAKAAPAKSAQSGAPKSKTAAPEGATTKSVGKQTVPASHGKTKPDGH